MTAPSVTALRGPVPPAPHGASAPGTALARRGPRGDERPLLPWAGARSLALALLLAFGAHHWMLMLDPAATARAWYAVAIGAVVAGGLYGVARLAGGRAWRSPAAWAVVLAGTALAVVGAGGDDALLGPGGWDELAAGVQRGVEGLPGIRVPYRGFDEWLRIVLGLGGTALAAIAAALAFWPRPGRRAGFPAAAVVALVALYAVPAVALSFEAEFVRGAVLAVLVLAFLRLERLNRRDAPAAAAVGLSGAVLALVAAPALDGLDPWWDYESWALTTAASAGTAFDWEHDYGPLDWPRDGREVLRVRSPVRSYWKADQLDVYNGRAWVRDRSTTGTREAPGALTDGVPEHLLDQWTTRMRVVVRNLRTETFVTAGSVKDIVTPGETEMQTSRAGVYASGRVLRRGDAYGALVYVPRPSERQLREAGAEFGTALMRYTRVGVRTGGDGVGLDGNPRTTVVDVRRFGAPPTEAVIDPLAAPEQARELLRSGDLARTWRLARRLLAASATPYDYVERVEAHLARGFRYTESPPSASESLEGFLFESRAGYCQQFSGAMALLLRLAGIPARVATGFSPGSYDREAEEYVVRDSDAHSWVEAWFPGVGWVVRDPTPTTAPPRSQASEGAPAAVLGDVRDIGSTARPGAVAVADDGRGWTWPLAAALIAGALALTARSARRRRRSGPVAELQRALRVADGALAPATTLAALERRFAGSPGAAGYGGRALRRAVGAGGPLRRLRAWWALPPRLRS